MYVNIVKPVYDWILAFFALIILSPLLFIIAILIKIDSPGPVFFLQERLGRNGKVFKIVKFRSMVNRPDNFMFGKPLQANDPKITKMGSFVRKTSIDEIPQLINILKGDMSFIGPRATLPAYKEQLLKRYPERFEATPGITSLPAIRGRNTLDWDHKFSLDVEYVHHFGFKMDLEIFLKTIPVVFGREGISMPGQATTTRYDQKLKNKK